MTSPGYGDREERFHKYASSRAGKLLLSPIIMIMATLPARKAASFNFFDGAIGAWLIVGIIRGRKRGMTQELLPTLQWLGIVILAGLFYLPFSTYYFSNHQRRIFHSWWNIAAYA